MGATTPVEAFGLLANDQRMGILEALWTERGPMPLSRLREEAGIRDSGQFNYHLGKLRGLYVRETEAGYELTRPGRRVLTTRRSRCGSTGTSTSSQPNA